MDESKEIKITSVINPKMPHVALRNPRYLERDNLALSRLDESSGFVTATDGVIAAVNKIYGDIHPDILPVEMMMDCDNTSTVISRVGNCWKRDGAKHYASTPVIRVRDRYPDVTLALKPIREDGVYIVKINVNLLHDLAGAISDDGILTLFFSSKEKHIRTMGNMGIGAVMTRKQTGKEKGLFDEIAEEYGRSEHIWRKKAE